MMPVKPTVSRIVHYVSAGSADGTYPSVCRAAIVTAVLECDHGREACVSLAVFNPEGLHFNLHVQYDNDRSPFQERRQTWHWPEREEGNLAQQITGGLKSIDEARKELGQEPWGLPETE